ncbi:hypothetical protein [Streptomyces albogriseolus]|uniref:hypothetical protein n=1 Tax=Streptomyces albogriseolus TaxID=1887 RepID=UPI003CE80C49
MTRRPTGPACGNNPNQPISDGDRQAVDWFKAYLEQRADGRGDIVRYRKKPVEVFAMQWTGDNEQAVQAFTGGPDFFHALTEEDRAANGDDPAATAAVYDKLHSTWVLVYTGQHIVRGVKGEYYPIAEDVLAETYERADAVSAAVAPPTQAAAEIREQLLHAIDHAYTTGVLGYGTPEDLLAAYDTSRTPPATEPTDRAALREQIAAAIRSAACNGDCGDTEEDCRKKRIQPFVWHHGKLAIVEGTPEQLADAVLAVLPSVDRAAVLREAANRAEVVALHLRLKHDTGAANGAYEVMDELRRMADETPAAPVPTHLGNKANAEDCPACKAEARNLPYPFLCPAEPAAGARQDGGQP